MPILSVFAPLLKSRFFVIYYRCVTLADGIVGAVSNRPRTIDDRPYAQIFEKLQFAFFRATISS